MEVTRRAGDGIRFGRWFSGGSCLRVAEIDDEEERKKYFIKKNACLGEMQN